MSAVAVTFQLPAGDEVPGTVVTVPQDGSIVRLTDHPEPFLAGRADHQAGDATHAPRIVIPLTVAPRGWA